MLGQCMIVPVISSYNFVYDQSCKKSLDEEVTTFWHDWRWRL